MKKLFTTLVLFAIIGLSARAQWIRAGLDSLTIYSLTVKNGDTIFAGGGNGVYKSSDYGNSWTALNNGMSDPYSPGYNYTVYSLAIKGDTMFAGYYSGIDNGGIFLSTNDGNNWDSVNTGLPTKANIAAFLLKGDTVFAADGSCTGVYISTNTGHSWDSVNTGLGNGFVNALVLSGNNLFAGTDGGIYKSSNNGNNWTAMNNGLRDTRIFSLVTKGDSIFAGTYSDGVFMSTNNGNSWDSVNTGLTNNPIPSLLINGNNIYAGTGYYMLTNGGVYFSTNNGGNWAEENYGLGNYCIWSLAISGNYLFAGTNLNGVWKLPLSELGINEINNNESDISIYPNPATDNLTINVSATLNTPAIIEITNIQGQVIKQQTTNLETTNIVVSALAKGMYFVKVKTEGGVEVKKFIKE